MSVLPLVLIIVSGLHAPERPPQDTGPAAVFYSPRSDTIDAGELFVTNLPDSVGGLPVSRYTGVRLPALSLLKGTSFFWRTREIDRGEHAFWFYLFREGNSQTPDDSLSVTVSVR